MYSRILPQVKSLENFKTNETNSPFIFTDSSSQQRVVQPPYVGIFNSFSPVVDI